MVKKSKPLAFMPDEVSFVIMKDGKIMASDNDGNLICINEEKSLSIPDVTTMNQIIETGNILNNPGGLYYETTRMLLDKQRFFMMTNGKKQEIRAGFKEEIDISDSFGDNPIKLTVYDSDDIADWMSFFAAKSGKYPKKLVRFVRKTKNVVLSYSITRIINQGIEMLRESSSFGYREAGEILYARYIHPDYGDQNVEFFMEISRKKKTAYFEALKKSTSLMSCFLFGVFPGDLGLLEIDSGDDFLHVIMKGECKEKRNKHV